MKRYAFLYTISMYTVLSQAMIGESHNAARYIMGTKPFQWRLEHALKLSSKAQGSNRPEVKNGVRIVIQTALELCAEEKEAWFSDAERTQQEKDWYQKTTEQLSTAHARLKSDTASSVQEEGEKRRNDWVSRIMATEAFRQAEAVASTANGPQSSGSEAASEYPLSLPELLQAISEARKKQVAIEQERADSETALKEVESRLSALVADQKQFGNVSAKSSQAAGTLAILIATLASDAENASTEAQERKRVLQEAQKRHQALAAEMAGTVQAANIHYNTAAAQRAETERRLQDLAFEAEQLRRNHEKATRVLEQLNEARELAAALGQAGALTLQATDPRDD